MRLLGVRIIILYAGVRGTASSIIIMLIGAYVLMCIFWIRIII